MVYDSHLLNPASTSPASAFWGINQSIRYGSSTTILSNTAGIVGESLELTLHHPYLMLFLDTGTTLVLIASDAFRRYQTATGAVADRNTGLLRLTTAQFANLQSLFFTTNGVRGKHLIAGSKY